MLLTTGRGLSPLNIPLPIRSFSLTSSLPSDISYARNDSVATYIDGNGDMQIGAVNAPRFNHDSTGKALGIMIEPSRQNKCTNTNVNPVDTANINLGGAGTPTLVVIDDSAALAASGLDKICTNGKVYKLTGGTSNATATFIGQLGNTNAHSYSVWARGEGTDDTGKLRRSGVSSTEVNITAGGTYQRYTIENDTPSVSTNELRVSAFPGESVYFILNQAEEGPFVTSEIVISGAAATRLEDDLYIDVPNNSSWFDERHGFMSVTFRSLNKVTAASQYLIVAHSRTTAETIGFCTSTNNDLCGYVRSVSIDRHSADNNDETPLPGNYLHSAAIIWKSGEASIMSSGVKNTQTYSGDPSGITRIDIGSNVAGADTLFGHIMHVEIGREYPGDEAAGHILVKNFDTIILGSGQSNMLGYFDSSDSGSGQGRFKFLEKFNEQQPALDVLWAEGATGGAALLEEATTDPTNYFIDDSTGLWDGDGYNNLVTALKTSGNKAGLFIWDQGEQDAHNLDATIEPSKTTYKTRLLELFIKVRVQVGNIPVLIIPIGRRTSGFTNTGGMQIVRDVQRELATENTWIHLGPEKIDQALSTDQVHLTDTAYQNMGTRIARKSLDLLGYAQSGVDGPSVSGASRSGTSVTVTISHDDGVDFTPASAIEGFHFFDNATAINITAAMRTNATTITLTLASAPTGVETLYYLYDNEATLNPSNVVMDNAAVSMPLQNVKVTL